jgi:preprotein translocase subunit SecD
VHRDRCKKAGLSGLFFHWAIAIVLTSTLLVVANAEPIAIDVVSAEVGFDQRSGEPVISFKMTPASQGLFANFTAANVGRKMDIRMDGQTLMSAVIREPIVGGTGQIADRSLTAAQMKDLAGQIAAGRAKIEFEIARD